MQLTREQDSASIWTPSTPLPHMVQLDALRALAVLAVLVAHLSPRSSTVFKIAKLIDLGGLGVRLFFVISGFLITGILLRSKSYAERNRLPVTYSFRQFYVRRILRIFPLFYLVLSVAALLDILPVRQTFAWNATYLTNFYIFLNGWNGSINHLWTLAVEEQFYLVWPWIILLTDRRNLRTAFLVTIGIGPVFRLVCGLCTGNEAAAILPFSCLDTLGMGAVLALYKDQIGRERCGKYPFGTVGLLTGLAVLLVFVLLGVMNRGMLVREVIFDIGAALIGGWIIWNASIGIGGVIGKFFKIRPLLYIGTISYGIYLYHNFVLHFMFMRFSILHSTFVATLLIGGITILLAALSWHFFERPINNLKRYFKYYPHRLQRKMKSPHSTH
jgi:peptidoglycan/LPS O-acetylase OafA/YrhL